MDIMLTKSLYNGYKEDGIDFIFKDDYVEIRINDSIPKTIKISNDDFLNVAVSFKSLRKL